LWVNDLLGVKIEFYLLSFSLKNEKLWCLIFYLREEMSMANLRLSHLTYLDIGVQS
jgi:hypothetical protein